MGTELTDAISAKELDIDIEELFAAAVGPHKGLSRRGREECCRAAMRMLPDLIDTRIRLAASRTHPTVAEETGETEPPRLENRTYTTVQAREFLLAHGFPCQRVETVRRWVREGRLRAVWWRSGLGRGVEYHISPGSLSQTVTHGLLPAKTYENPYGPEDVGNTSPSVLLAADPAPTGS